MNNKKHCVYAHINKINQKVYIGQTCNIKDRWCLSSYQKSLKFYRAIQKYGWQNFDHIILLDNLTQEEANLCEQELIKKYNTIQLGYNIRQGGTVSKLSEQTKQKIKEFNLSDKNPNAKSVICLQTKEIFYSPRAAAEAKGLKSEVSIRQACLGKTQTAKGLHWRYYKEGEDYSNIDLSLDSNHCYNPVRCVETQEIFETAKEAALYFGGTGKHAYHGIMNCCKGKQHTSFGMHWEFVQSGVKRR